MEKKYYPVLDGVRAIACMSVLLFHASVPGFSYGWIGVQIFFVLSGFLITGILMEKEKSSRYFVDFWQRRMLRIFPIYYITLVLCIFIDYQLGRGAGIKEFLYFFSWSQNYLLGLQNFAVNLSVMNHSWSLAVEQQFYLLWPIVIYYLRNTRKIILVMFMLIIGANFSRVYLSAYFFDLPISWTVFTSNMDTLICGGAAYVFLKNTKLDNRLIRRGSFYLIVLMISLYLILSYVFNVNVVWEGKVNLAHLNGQLFLSLLAPLLAVIMILLLIEEKNFIVRMLSSQVFKYVGKISYGLYLYHFPVFLYIDMAKFSEPMISYGLKFCITFSIAILSWEFFEKKMLGNKFFVTNKFNLILMRRK